MKAKQFLKQKLKAFDQINLAITAFVSLMILAGVVIALTAFQSSQANTTTAWQILNDTLTMGLNLSTQLPTVGTILGVAILIGVLVGGFAIGGLYLYNRMRR